MAPFLNKVWRFLRALIWAVHLTAVICTAIIAVALTELEQERIYETLTITLMILVGSILGAAAVATLAHGWFATLNRPEPPSAAVFST